ncbi:LLM class flavin-dependent oxidoreductase [Nocardia xishanensis]|uniref:LLM class flavin-dependent oxidoreductase n=1 Tax=Nocardia xishanensis TaxID=238964 RepID=UPI0024808D20|nr:LLM class flavin-dependent oxidoreductase [Nocardia xishanensis]
MRATERRAIAAYLNVPVYGEFHRWLGRGEQLDPMWRHGRPETVLAAIPDKLIDELRLHGTPAEIRARVKDYVDAGVTTPVLAIMPAAGEAPPSTVSIAAIGRACRLQT